MTELMDLSSQHISVEEYLDSQRISERGNQRKEDEDFDNDAKRKRGRNTSIAISNYGRSLI